MKHNREYHELVSNHNSELTRTANIPILTKRPILAFRKKVSSPLLIDADASSVGFVLVTSISPQLVRLINQHLIKTTTQGERVEKSCGEISSGSEGEFFSFPTEFPAVPTSVGNEKNFTFSLPF